MPAFIDLTGKQFSKLTVSRRAGRCGKKVTWLCICECGKETIVHGHSLTSNRTRSCGCLIQRNVCVIPDCGRFVFGHGYCQVHYLRWRKHGDPLHTRPTPEQRYHASYHHGSDSECWNWTGGLTEDGYGKLKVGRKTLVASRYGWMLLNGPIPDGMLVCHTCDNPACQNPGHWFLGTPLDNMTDKMRKGRHVGPGGRAKKQSASE